MKSFFIENKNLKINDEFYLNDIEHNHLSKVLRMRVGEDVEVYPNNGTTLICEIVEITKKTSKLKVKEILISTTNPKSNLTLYTALLKGDKFEFLITKLTELGVSKIVPFESDFCIGKANYDKTERHIQIAKDACKQCKRTNLIEIKQAISFNDVLDEIKNYDMVIFAYEKENAQTLSKVFNNLNENSKVAIIVGSEGGFSETEAQKIIDAGAKCVSLGNRILRAETASIMLSAITLYKLKEFDIKNS